jgi:hypothetical protein
MTHSTPKDNYSVNDCKSLYPFNRDYLAMQVAGYIAFARQHEMFEDSDEGLLPIRLRYYDEQLSLAFGDSQYDTDHKGLWAYSYLTFDTDAYSMIDELFSQLGY